MFDEAKVQIIFFTFTNLLKKRRKTLIINPIIFIERVQNSCF